MNQNLRAVLVGCGAISERWLRTAGEMADLQIVALVDLEETAARKRAAEFDLDDALVSADLTATLEETCPDIVFDCTVPDAHVHVTQKALQHGCHVLGEKPLADTLENAHKMVRAAEKANRLYAVMQNCRFLPDIRRLKGFLETGEIGPVTTVHSDFFIGAHFGGFRDRMPHVLLLDMAIHTFDATRMIMGADALAVSCQEWNPPGSWYAHGASASAVFEMTNRIVYTYRGSWCAEGLNTNWESEWRIIGEQGSVRWDGGAKFQVQKVAETGGFMSKLRDVDVPAFDDPAKTGGHAGLIRDFVRCVQSGATPETICWDNIKSLAMVIGAVESAKTGKKVAIGP